MKKETAYIIPHTHWDREWRYPIWKNRALLVEFMEKLLDTLEHDPDYRCFLLDGQVAPIEDYLEVMPEHREKVTAYIKEGRIAVGPWYTLPDLYPLDGECLVRNLLKGIRVSEEFGNVMKVGYNSFGWGQTAQFPQIYNEFGMDFIVCAKKVSEERAPESEFIWEAPDGTQVLTSRLGQHARANFYFHTFLYAKYGINCISSEFKYSPEISGVAMHNADISHNEEDFFIIDPVTEYKPDLLKKGMDDAWNATDATLMKDHRLFLNGTDFSTPHPELSAMLKDLNKLYKNREFVNTRLEEYAEKLHETIDKSKLRTIIGELRDGPACDCSGNALASRIYLKQLNKKAQNVIMRKAEPLASSLFLMGKNYPSGFFKTAWKYMLQSHPHDSINGVTQDKTASDVEYRLNQALEIGSVTYDKMVRETLNMIDLSAYGSDEQVLVVFNPLPRPVEDVIKVSVCTPAEKEIWRMAAEDSNGKPLAVQDISRSEKAFPVHDLEARPWPFFADRHNSYLETGEIPACGYKVIRFKPETHFQRNHFYWLEMRKSQGNDICHSDNILENEFLRVEINNNGSLKMTDKNSNRTYDSLHYFEDSGDVGNYWAYYPPYNNKIINTLTGNASACIEDNGPLSATIAITYSMEVPATAHEAKYGIQGDSKRSDTTVLLNISSRVTLKKDSKRVDIRTTLDNNAENHRLRVAFPTGINAEYADASGHFTVDSRPKKPQKDKNGDFWPEMQTLPMQHFVDVSDGKQGLALLNNGLTEYELKDDERSTLYLTLFRSMGNMIVTWWEAVGVFPDQTGSKMQRPFEFEYSIYPHEGNWVDGNVYDQAERFNASPAPYQITPHNNGILPEVHSFMSIEPENLILSAFKKAEDRESCIIRLYNPTAETLSGSIRFASPLIQAYRLTMNEERQNEIKTNDNTIAIEIEHHKIITIEIIPQLTNNLK